ncbi:adenylyl-sulfate kinase [Helicobacter sp. 11S02596-1]|uniref:adenylyl-sulfate kinase n=1 Tax=Helicobacter sp. 11S02596-1 TaxID=1476194 RepID=UPI000BA6591C|nr:adenylyl-sulfate kinase [Helicobacter sp. 11S02596-1]PAF45179.1 adenylyl-sulfate kinase [Helicobacter sp. 11S02596-1]
MKNGLVIWINGLAGSGKSTIGKNLYTKLKPTLPHLVYLDGDGFRELFGYETYDKQSRIEFAFKRSALCHFLASQGIHVIATTISLFEEVYRHNRKNLSSYLEIYIQCDMEALIQRDQKNLYSNALKGQIKDVVGIDIRYDEPSSDLVIENNTLDDLDGKTNQILDYIKKHQLIRF